MNYPFDPQQRPVAPRITAEMASRQLANAHRSEQRREAERLQETTGEGLGTVAAATAEVKAATEEVRDAARDLVAEVAKVHEAVLRMDSATRRAQTISLVLAGVATLAAIVSLVLALT